MSEIFKAYFIDYAEQLAPLFGAVMLLTLIIITAYWFYNKRKFHKLAHQIPASVVKSYLDSIIQNSSALKSSLFRGGGADVGVPSVLPVSDLGGGDNVGVSDAVLNQKNAEIASLSNQLGEKTSVVSDLESKIADLENRVKEASSGDSGELLDAKNKEIDGLKEQVSKLEEDLKNAPAGGGADSGELEAVSKERDELKERLQEYEIIEDDLANLKKLQQENEQLKKALEAAGGSAPAPAEEPAPAAEAPPAPEPEPEPEAAPAPEPEPEPTPEPPAAEAAPEPAPEDPGLEGEEKSAEDLLNEFEKMLG